MRGSLPAQHQRMTRNHHSHSNTPLVGMFDLQLLLRQQRWLREVEVSMNLSDNPLPMPLLPLQLPPLLPRRQKKRTEEMQLLHWKRSLSWSLPAVYSLPHFSSSLLSPLTNTSVGTVGEALFLLDSSAATCPPQLQVTNHGLSVRNTMNKKWSTIRSTVRLSSGIHRWEVVIDRSVTAPHSPNPHCSLL
jgi:hypothetical protein